MPQKVRAFCWGLEAAALVRGPADVQQSCLRGAAAASRHSGFGFARAYENVTERSGTQPR